MTEQTAVQNCPSHTESYRGRRKTMPYGSDEVGPWEFTCSRCGHTWTVDPPALELRVKVEVEAEAKLDVIGYFNGLHPSAQEEYQEFDLERVGYGEEWERPVAFLWTDDVDLCSILPTHVITPPGQPQIARELIDVTDQQVRLDSRGGRSVWGQDAEWTEADFATLRKAVPWLDAWHASQGGYDAEDSEDLARRPGPNDVPLQMPEEAGDD